MTMPAYSGQDLYGIIQAMIREEFTRLHIAELGEVTEVFCHESDSDKNNYQASVTLRDSGLVLPKVSVATQRIGAVAVPNIGDLVLVQFIGGDRHRPVITGRLYNDVDRPPVAKSHEWVYESRDAEESNVRRFALLLPNNNQVIIDDDTAVIEMGDASITVEHSGNVSIKVSGDIKLEADGNIKLRAGGDLALEAGGALTAKATTDLKAEGMTATVKASTSAKVEGSADATLKGAMVTIAGMTNFSAG
ncbi:MAG: phage baseplate assembly protein V [Gammaproteobacteria bacterium]